MHFADFELFSIVVVALRVAFAAFDLYGAQVVMAGGVPKWVSLEAPKGGSKAWTFDMAAFKRAFTPNRDQHWRSFAKVWRDQDTNGEMAGGFEPSSPSSKLWLPLLPHWMPSCDHLDAEL